MISNWIDITVAVAGFTLPLLCLFEGVRQMSAIGFSRTALLLVCAGLMAMLAHLGYSYWTHQFQEKTIALLSKGGNIPTLPTDWGKDLTPENRVELSTEMARAAFHDHGRIQYIIDLSGTQQIFVPTSGDLHEREERVASLTRLKVSAENTALLPTRIAITTILIALFGFGFGRAKKRTALSP